MPPTKPKLPAPPRLAAPAGVTIKGDQHTSWGARNTFVWTAAGVTYSARIVKNCRVTQDGEKATVPDSVGNTTDHILFDDRHDAEIEIAWRDNEIYPVRRDLAMIGGVYGLVTKVENTWAQREVRGCRVTVEAFSNVDYGVTPSSGSSSSAAPSSGSSSSAAPSSSSGS